MISLPFISENEDLPTSEIPEMEKIEAIWKFFVDKRGAPLLPSCAEIEILIGWMKMHVPEIIIKKGIRQAVLEYQEKHINRSPSLTYCKHEVTRLFKDFSYKEINRNIKIQTSDTSWGLSQKKLLNDLIAESNLRIQLIPLTDKEKKETLGKIEKFIETRHKQCNNQSLECFGETLTAIDKRLTNLLLKKVPEKTKEQIYKQSKAALLSLQPNFHKKKLNTILKSLLGERLRLKYGLKPLINLLMDYEED